MATTKSNLIDFINIRRKQIGGDTRACCNMDSYIRDIQMLGFGKFILCFANDAATVGYSKEICDSLTTAAHILLDDYEEVAGRCKKLNKVYKMLGEITKKMKSEI